MSVPEQEVQAPFVADPPRLPLVNKLQNRYSSRPLEKDARLINCYAEYDAELKGYNVVKRPGLAVNAAFTTLTGIAGAGMYTHAATGALIYGFRRNTINGAVALYSTGSGIAPIDVGTVTLSDNRLLGLSFETINSNPQTVFVGGGGSAALVDTTTWAVTAIVDPDFVAINRVPGAVYLNQILYVMDYKGNIYGSAADNGAAWDPLNKIQASSNADLGVGLAKQLSYVIALKQYTTQAFYDAGNPPPGSALAPLPDSQIPLGCAAAMSIQSIDNSLLWLTANQTSSPQIVQMDNLTPKIVSSPAVERILLNVGVTGGILSGVTFIQFSGVYSWVLKHNGHRFYGLTLSTLNITLIYDLDQELWYVWQSSTGGQWPMFSMAYVPSSGGNPGIHYAQTTGTQIFPLDEDKVYPTDSGVICPVDIYTPNIDMQTVRSKMWSALYLTGDRVDGSILQVRYSDDDYSTWSNFRRIDMSRKKPSISGLGTSSTRRAFHFRLDTATSMRIRYVSPQVDIGTL